MFRCRSCDAKVLWAVTIKNKRIPLDVEPVLGGNIDLRPQGKHQHFAPIAIVVKPDPNVKRYKSHFATCPQSTAWRKQNGGKGH